MPRLTDQEKQDIIRHLEADKPLPEKYRFLLFEDKREVELVWHGKTNEVTNVVLPFQVIEQVDEPRAEKPNDTPAQADLFDERGRQLKGWTNKLIWGDNKLILSSLKNGPLREEIEKQGGLTLIYIDPPFDVGADFSMDIEVGENVSLRSPVKTRLIGIQHTKPPHKTSNSPIYRPRITAVYLSGRSVERSDASVLMSSSLSPSANTSVSARAVILNIDISRRFRGIFLLFITRLSTDCQNSSVMMSLPRFLIYSLRPLAILRPTVRIPDKSAPR